MLAVVLALSAAQETAPPATKQVMVDAEAGVPVFAGDIADRRYVVLGEVRAGVRKATIVSGASSRAKIYRELWERARKMGADAVIHAEYGRSHISAFSWGQTDATGTAVKFVNRAEQH